MYVLYKLCLVFWKRLKRVSEGVKKGLREKGIKEENVGIFVCV